MSSSEPPVVVAIDGSPRAPQVLAQGLAIAAALGAKAHVFRAVSIEGEAHEDLAERTPQETRDALASDAARDLRTLLYDAKTAAEAHAVVAAPVSGICAFAKQTNARLVVIGTHGHGTLEKLLGTTAARVVESAPCDVYVVRCSA